ncbi:MAG TPA: dTDP-glucose 4,6-dehydratase [Candidatus Saccharimonadales bacterium]|nr:dTDP-glucose 4,6-dehydratase [Candidatus Saccharimonadales bacterium]
MASLDLGRSRLLVTGGAGFIGSHFVKMALARYPEIRLTVLDKLTYAGNLANLREVESDPRYRFVRGDICDPKVVEELLREHDVAANFAAESFVDKSIDDPGQFVLTDMYGTYVLLEAARRHGLKRFLQVSTDEVYGEVLEGEADEAAALMPRNPYSASKAGADRLAFSYFATYGAPVVITRASNNYGSHQYPEKLIPLFVTNALEDQPLPVYGSGRNTRDWMHVEDHCEALLQVLAAPDVEGETFNVGAGNEYDVLGITERILRVLGKPAGLVRHVKDRPGHDRRYALDTRKIRERLGWQPRRSFEQGLEETVRWYREHPEWWRPIKSGEFKREYLARYGALK